ncbi:hypothetical protein BKA65DRAFT_570734 [Rhexocercosporidium sp. MPI-PUGE-AT-0058]|nr:hypothetical protein BKA65DRAFT_570734 [Rhexocercosporidium sp. MPI-PUGE-AT-0058]
MAYAFERLIHIHRTSQEFDSGGGEWKGRSLQHEEQGSTSSHRQSNQPRYITVGSGSISASAARLQALLDTNDSGYGGSSSADSLQAWGPSGGMMSTSVPAATWEVLGAPDEDRGTRANAIHQLWYNKHRASLVRSVTCAVEMLKSLQEMKSSWPATYPSSQTAKAPFQGKYDVRKHHLGRFGESSTEAESSRAAEARIAHDFAILKLDLKLGTLHQTELVHSLEKRSIASLLDGKINSSIKHLLLLRERIEDSSSKVLVTGDLNTGKSTFCNALLRRKILPEDQQPCTSIFCEVLDTRENGGIEEVHAVYKESTIVTDNQTYTQCKVYVTDNRTTDESLLHNGVVDISIIDAPGLNSDTTQTTAVFARQEEIDVVVFVVSAANHFTQTAKEFIWAAAAEKAYIFMVVNGYDMIKDKERFQRMVMEQLHGLSPRTLKESADLVHFVSSNAISSAGPSHPRGYMGLHTGDGPDSDPSDSQGSGGEDEKDKLLDFERLEQSLRHFVLERRARSKLALAKTYLLNLLGDVHTLASVNQEVAQTEFARVSDELADLEPVLQASRKRKREVSCQVDTIIETTCKGVFDHARSTLTSVILDAGTKDLGVPYPGLLMCFRYADDLKDAMLYQISQSVTACEDHARRKTVESVNSIKELGLHNLSNEYIELSFKSESMFRRKRDILAREIPILQRHEKVAGTGMFMTVATVVGGRVVGGLGRIDGALGAFKIVGDSNLRKLTIPVILATTFAATAFILSHILRALPQRLSTKIATQLQSIDYSHANSNRISSSVRRVLRYPTNDLKVSLQRTAEQLGRKREETRKIYTKSEVAKKYFGNLISHSAEIRSRVEAVDLDDPTSEAATMSS